MRLSLFNNETPELVISSFYGFPSPSPAEVSKRDKAVAKVKRELADKLRCNSLIQRLEKPL